MSNLASNMEGKQLADGWTVAKKFGSNVGCFSSGYSVINKDRKAEGFLKVLNYEYSFQQTGVGRMSSDFIAKSASEFNYERDLYKFCEDNGIKSVIKSMGHGEYYEPGMLPVPYIILEFANGGALERDIRLENLNLRWRLEIFHGVTKALRQLHQGQVAHKDLHAGNLLMQKESGREVIKIGDLGRADKKDELRNFNGKTIIWPYELFYNDTHPDWDWSISCDCFSLGCLLYNLMTDGVFTANVFGKLDNAYRPLMQRGQWRGNYQDVLPYVEAAFYDAIQETTIHIEKLGGETSFNKRLIGIISCLCHPNPRLRSHANNFKSSLGGTDYSLERVLSDTDWILKKAITMK